MKMTHFLGFDYWFTSYNSESFLCQYRSFTVENTVMQGRRFDPLWLFFIGLSVAFQRLWHYSDLFLEWLL